MALTPTTRIWLARGIAAAADLLQAGLFPLFAEGFLSPLNGVVDCVVALLMWWLVGWHIAFLPSFVAEQVPFLNLAPTWSIAVWFVTRRGTAASKAAP
jgi:hypothetical protein